MKNDFTLLVWIQDISGSIASIKGDVIGGFNSFINEQRKLPGEAQMVLVNFNEKYHKIYDFVGLDYVNLLDDKTFVPSGLTGLLDAIGRTINEVGQKLAQMDEQERPQRVIVSVSSDGLENASTVFSKTQIAEMIEHQKNKYNWQFVFIGTGFDAISEGKSLNVNFGQTMSYNGMNASYAYMATSSLVGSMRACNAADMGTVGFSAEVRKKAASNTKVTTTPNSQP